MASKKDLVEAYAYNRRRLVTAFVSGAPGGREMEPSRPGRAIVVGVVLAGLVVGAGAITGAIKPTVKKGWDNNRLVIGKDTGARYVTQGGKVFPVLNTASARLVIPPDEFDVVYVPEDKIAEREHGQPIGIIGAPDALPGPGDLIQTGWVSCADRSRPVNDVEQAAGMSLNISRTQSAVATPEQAVVVRADGVMHVIAGSLRYQVARANETKVLLGLGLPNTAAWDVPAAWVNQFNSGTVLGPVVLPGVGAALPAGAGLPAEVRNGSVVAVGDGANRIRRFLATPPGLVELNEVQVAMYRQGNAPQGEVTLTSVSSATKVVPDVPAEFAQTQNWPARLPEAFQEPTTACAILQTSERGSTVTMLARAMPDARVKPKPGGLAQSIDIGRGALVSAGPGGPVFLIDATGKRYPLAAHGERSFLGYGALRPIVVPTSWIEALALGPTLDRTNVPGAKVAAAS